MDVTNVKDSIFILGDSYSTYEGHIPQGYAAYYAPETKWEAKLRDHTYTWWHRYIKDTDSILVRNSSYSGTTICYTGYDGADVKNTSFITRIQRLIDSGFFKENKVDTLFVFGGTNDSWANAPLGEMMYKDWTQKDLYFVLPAIGYLLNLLKENFADTKVVCILNSDEYKPEILKAYTEALSHYGIDYIEVTDFDKLSGHPTELGMEQIEKQILKGMEKIKKGE